jgi:hypothetical protein
VIGRLAPAICLLIAHIGTASPEIRWLIIAASNKEIRPVLRVQKKVATFWPYTVTAVSQDCANFSPGLYLTLVSMASDRATAMKELRRLKSEIPDAYAKECLIKPDSLLRFGIPAVDPSIEKVPSNVVNWADSDRVSQIISLPEGGHLWIRRIYVPDPEDPREGRRVAILFFEESPEQARLMESDCSDFQTAQRGGAIALSCARAIAGNTLFHNTDVFAQLGRKKINTIEHCRNPRFISEREMSCEEEHVGADGELRFIPKTVRF